MTTGVGSRVALRARELLARGSETLAPLPTPKELAARPAAERHELLEGLRVELLAISSIVAEATVERVYRERASHPPYGLLRSGHSDWKLLLDSPETVGEGSVDNFYVLGKAYVDTVVFHLHRQFGQLRTSEQVWMFHRLEELLALFRIDAGPFGRSRMRDGLSFVYGGLHFGTGVCVQLAQVMALALAPYPALGAAERAQVLLRSSRPAFRLAAFNIDHVIVVYEGLLAPPAGPGGKEAAGFRWFKPENFVVQEAEGRPERVDLRPEEVIAARRRGRQLHEIPTTYATHGCPARLSPAGASPPIAILWSWCVQLAHDTGLLGETAGELGEQVPAQPG